MIHWGQTEQEHTRVFILNEHNKWTSQGQQIKDNEEQVFKRPDTFQYD